MPVSSHSIFAAPHRAKARGALAASLLAWACGGEPVPAGPALDALPPLPERREDELPRGEARPLRELAIALTGEVRGEIDPCGCPTNPTGGFVRRRNLLEELRAETTVFHLDAGEMLLRGLATERPASRVERAELILDLVRDVGLDAWAPGPSDAMAVGLDRLEALARGEAPRLVNASWRDEAGAPLLPAATVVRRDGLAVGVVGVSGDPPPDEVGVPRVLEPVAAAGDGVARLPEGLDLVVVLGVMSEEASHAIAAEVPGVDLVLTTAGESLDPPWSPPGGGALVVETPDRGRHVRVVRMVLGTTSDHPPVLRPEEQAWRDRLTLREQARRTGRRPPRLDELERRFAEEARGRNLAWVVTVPLEADLDEPTDDAATTDDLAAAIARFKAHTLDRAARRAAAPPKPREPRYAASGACVNCHSKEMARWAFTKHARAWEALLLRREDGNPECIPCHTTGFGEPGGFGEPTETNIRKFKAVQCEACHGPMGGHPDDRGVRSAPITPARCTGCHDAANDPDFDFDAALPRASCQAPGGHEL